MDAVVVLTQIFAIPALVFAAKDVGERAFDAAVGAASSHRRNMRFAARGIPVATDDSDDDEHAVAKPAIAWKVIDGRLHPFYVSDEPER